MDAAAVKLPETCTKGGLYAVEYNDPAFTGAASWHHAHPMYRSGYARTSYPA
jgi:hypothetical protein